MIDISNASGFCAVWRCWFLSGALRKYSFILVEPVLISVLIPCLEIFSQFYDIFFLIMMRMLCDSYRVSDAKYFGLHVPVSDLFRSLCSIPKLIWQSLNKRIIYTCLNDSRLVNSQPMNSNIISIETKWLHRKMSVMLMLCRLSTNVL